MLTRGSVHVCRQAWMSGVVSRSSCRCGPGVAEAEWRSFPAPRLDKLPVLRKNMITHSTKSKLIVHYFFLSTQVSRSCVWYKLCTECPRILARWAFIPIGQAIWDTFHAYICMHYLFLVISQVGHIYKHKAAQKSKSVNLVLEDRSASSSLNIFINWYKSEKNSNHHESLHPGTSFVWLSSSLAGPVVASLLHCPSSASFAFVDFWSYCYI